MEEVRTITKLHRIIRRSSAILLGMVYLFSGAVKLIDPVGGGFVITEYFKLAGLAIPHTAAKAIAEALALLETTMGAALIAGVWRKAVAIAASAVTAFFTALTAFLLVTNPEMDCGCFGEAIHLTHLQTFLKNIVLCALCLAAFLPYKDFGPVRKVKYYSFFSVCILAMVITAWSWLGIPMIDYTDYKPGAELQASADSYSYDDSYTYPVLSFYDAGGEYCDSMAANGKVMVTSIYDPLKVKDWNSVKERQWMAYSSGFEPLLLVSGSREEIYSAISSQLSEWEAEEMMESIFFSDYKTLATLNRSNGGATFINDGIIVCKWSEIRYPDQQELDRTASDNAIKTMLLRSSRGRLRLQIIAIYSLFVMLVL